MASRLLKFLMVLPCFFFAGHSRSQDTVTKEIPPTVQEIPSDTLFGDMPVLKSPSSLYFDSIVQKQYASERVLPDSVVQAVKKDDAYWYADLAPEKKEIKPRQSITDQPWFRTIFWILITGAFIGLLIWFLATGNISLFRKRSKAVNEEGEEGSMENIHELDFESEIRKAVGIKNFRLAIRLLYLQTLRILSEKELIDYSHEKTNADYLRQLGGTAFYREFFRLTRNFEYSWYGEFQVSEAAFQQVQTDFSHFNKSLP